MCNEMFQNINKDHNLPEITWLNIDKGKYIIEYFNMPCFVIAKVVAKTNIPGINSSLGSNIYLFKTLSEAEEFFKKLIGD